MITLEELTCGESRNIEFKEMLPEKSLNYLKTVVAFANSVGGKIIFGVEDKTHKVVGVDDDALFQTMDSITNAIADACTPAILPDVSIQTIEGKNLIVVDVPMGRNRPYYIKSQGMVNGTYIRVSGTTRLAEEPKLKDLMFEGSGRSYDQTVWLGHKVTQAEIDSLCRQMKEAAIRNCAHDEMKGRIRDVTSAQLLSWHILEERDGELLPTHAWRILNGDDDMFLQIQCAVFKGKSRSIFVDKREYAGPVDEQIEQAFQFVLRNIHLGAQIHGVYRQDVYEIPPIAIRELIVNAVAHRNYLVPACIQIAIYDDRLEVTSPGSLPMGMTIEKMKSGQSLIRNHALARALSYMNLIENWGSGIRKITDSCLDAGLNAPEFIDMEISVRVNIYRIHVVENETDVVENTPQVMNDTHQVTITSDPVTAPSDPVTAMSDPVTAMSDSVLQLLKVFGDEVLSPAELRKRMGISHRTYFRKHYLTPALQSMLIEQVFPDKPNSRNQAYRITQRGRDVLRDSFEGERA